MVWLRNGMGYGSAGCTRDGDSAIRVQTGAKETSGGARTCDEQRRRDEEDEDEDKDEDEDDEKEQKEKEKRQKSVCVGVYSMCVSGSLAMDLTEQGACLCPFRLDARTVAYACTTHISALICVCRSLCCWLHK